MSLKKTKCRKNELVIIQFKSFKIKCVNPGKYSIAIFVIVLTFLLLMYKL